MRKKVVWISLVMGLFLCSACSNPGLRLPATPTPVPSAEPTQVVTVSPLPSRMPTNKPTATVTDTPQPTEAVTPTPMVNQMIGNGWQSVDDLNGCCRIVFPEVFLTGMVGGTEEEIVFQYLAQSADVSFFIRHFSTRSFDEMKEALSGAERKEETFFGAERSLSYTKEDEKYIYKGRIIEHNGNGNSDAAGKWKLLVLEFKYPKEEREKYETEQFHYYIVHRQ